MSKKPNLEIWGAWANVWGLSFTQPKKCKWDDQLKSYWYVGNWEIKKQGIKAEGLCLAFGSHDKREVQLFINGFLSACKLIYNFTNCYKER